MTPPVWTYDEDDAWYYEADDGTLIAWHDRTLDRWYYSIEIGHMDGGTLTDPPEWHVDDSTGRPVHAASAVDAQASPAAKTVRPAATTAVVPTRSTSRGPAMLASAMETATGSSRTPLWNAVDRKSVV